MAKIYIYNNSDQPTKEVISSSQVFSSAYRTEFIKNSIIDEFLGFTAHSFFRESELGQSIIDNFERFLLELGEGFAFVARQQHIQTEKEAMISISCL